MDDERRKAKVIYQLKYTTKEKFSNKDECMWKLNFLVLSGIEVTVKVKGVWDENNYLHEKRQ